MLHGHADAGPEALILASPSTSNGQHQQAAAAQDEQQNSHASISGNNGSCASCLLEDAPTLDQCTVSDRNAAADDSYSHPVLHSLGRKGGRNFSIWPVLQGHHAELHQSLLSAAAHTANSHAVTPADHIDADAHSLSMAAEHSSMCSGISSFLSVLMHYLKTIRACCKHLWPKAASLHMSATESLPISISP